MPWRKARDQRCPAGEPWAVIVDDGSDEVVGCHETEAQAQAQIDALYANDVATVAAAEHECDCHTRRAAQMEMVSLTSVPSLEAFARDQNPLRDVPASLASTMTEPFDTPFPVPEYPPAEWFDGPPDWVEDWRVANGYGPSLDPETGILKLTVTDEGRVGGYFYDAGQCIIHDHTACPGPSPTNYAAFHQNDIVVEGGAHLRVGVIGNTHGHASPWVDYVQAQRHYADPSAQMIVCRAGDDERGGWIAGAIIPGLTYGDVAMLRRSALSGDWRPMPATWWLAHNVSAEAVAAVEGYDAIGPTLVTRPALPLVTAYTAALADHPSAILGGNGGVQLAATTASVTSDIRELAQEIAVGQNRNDIKAGPILTLLNRAVAYLNGGDTAKAHDALTQAVEVAQGLEEKASGLKGLADRVQSLADAARGAALGSMPDGDMDGTVQQFVQEVPTGMRTTRLLSDGTIEIQDSTPEEDLAREQHVSLRASLIGDLDLPLAPVDRAWDADGARHRVAQFATVGDDLDETRFASAFLWRDIDPGGESAMFALPFADVVDGQLVAVPAGIAAAAAALDDMSAAARVPLRANLDTLYERMAAEHGEHALRAPWTAAPDDEMMDHDMGGEDESGPAEITAGQWAAMEERVLRLEEFAQAVLESQAAALVAAEPPDPFQAAAHAVADDAPLPDVAALTPVDA